MYRVLRSLVVLAVSIGLSACSFFGSRSQSLVISSDPAGAQVLINGEPVGSTPLRAPVSRGEDALIEVRMEGYETGFRTTSRSLSSLGIADVIGGSVIVLPFLGLLSDAAWEHEPSTFGFTLERQGRSDARD